MIKKTLTLVILLGGVVVLSGCGKQTDNANQQIQQKDSTQNQQTNTQNNSKEQNNTAAANNNVFDCGEDRTCLVANCKETKQCLYDLAANCSPTKGIVSYDDPSFDANTKFQVEHTIAGSRDSKCIYDGKIIASGGAVGFNGLAIHCELSNDLMQQVFTKGIFEKTIRENCSGTYVNFLKQAATPTSFSAANTKTKITFEKCLQQSGKATQIKADGTACGSDWNDLGSIEDSFETNGKLPQCCVIK